MKKHQKFSKITKWMFWFIALNFIGLSFAQSPNTGVYLSWDKESSCQNWSDDDEGVKFNDLDFDGNDCLKVCINSQVVFEIHNLDSSINVNWNINGGEVEFIGNHKVKISFNDSSTGFVNYSYLHNGYTVNRIICIQKLSPPFAKFNINNPLGEIKLIGF